MELVLTIIPIIGAVFALTRLPDFRSEEVKTRRYLTYIVVIQCIMVCLPLIHEPTIPWMILGCLMASGLYILTYVLTTSKAPIFFKALSAGLHLTIVLGIAFQLEQLPGMKVLLILSGLQSVALMYIFPWTKKGADPLYTLMVTPMFIGVTEFLWWLSSIG